MSSSILARYAWSVLLGIAALFLFTRYNEFPWYYHPDEPGKVKQVLTGDWNFHHPMLLLVAAKAVTPAGSREQAAVEAGRTVSAAFAALAVAALSLLAWQLRGPVAGIGAGLLLLTHHQLFELSHYLKEDTALLAGVALFFLALHAYGRRPGWGTALFLGVSCGLAASGKYIGAVVLLPALMMVFFTSGTRRVASVGLILGAFVLAFALLNLPLLREIGTFEASFGREMEYVVKGQKGMTRSVPHTEYLSAFRDNTTPVIWLLLGFSIYMFWRTRRTQSAAAWVTFLFPFLYTLALSCSPKSNDRYFLVCTAMFVFLCGLALPDLAAFVQRKLKTGNRSAGTAAVTAGLLLVAVCANVSSLPDPLDWKTLSEYVRAFRADDRADLRRWVEANLPGDAVIAQDNRAGLPTSDGKSASRQTPLTQKVIGRKTAASLGTLDELRAQGVQYVAASQSDYGRYFRSSLKPKKGEEDEYEKSRTFYERLFREGKLLWERKRGTVIYLHPGIEMYEIAANRPEQLTR